MVRPGRPQQAEAMNTTTNPGASDQTWQQPTTSHRPRVLCRPTEDRMLAGVAAGIAQYLDVDPTLIRIAFAVLTLFGGAAVLVYLAGWLLIPEEGSDQSIASSFVQSRQH
jgi:phage shock protein PspC (stress-responsive transcriptional regulator)